jgi:4,5-dihydroxyphthalate decarboxylase
MSDLSLSICFWDYDRTRPLLDGRIQIPGAAPKYSILNPVAAFAKAFSTAEFDVTELSLAGHIAAVAKGNAAYEGIPVHLSRTFRHSTIYIRADAGVETPADLKGKRIGIPDYDMTAAVILRGLFRDEYGLAPSDVAWRVGPLTTEVPPPTRSVAGVDIQTLRDGTIDQQLISGGLDAIITVHAPPSFAARDPRIKRLFPNWRDAEQTYAARSGQFPIMHVVGIRKSLLRDNPWLSRTLFDAFEQAKRMAIADLEITQAPRVTLPWVVAELAATRHALGDDFWPYGVHKNKVTLEALLRHSYEDGLTPRLLRLEDIFAADTLSL